jgi:carboxyl-terminal processing protease
MNTKWLFLLILSLSLTYVEATLMKEGDVKRIMDEIFRQHVDKKEMTPALYREAIEHFIRNADVDKVYLLASEVSPYLTLTDSALKERIREFNRGDFKYFKELNATVQKAYERARVKRASLASDSASLVYDVIRAQGEFPESFETWAESLEVLSERQQTQAKAFIHQWIHRYGKARAEMNPGAVLASFNEVENYKEDPYLYLNQEGSSLPENEAENLFSLHLLKAFAGSLDAHTRVYDPSEAEEMRKRLETGYRGVGIELKPGAHHDLVVKSLVENSSAAKSGLIQPGDKIMAVNGKSLKGIDIQAASSLLQSGEGKEVKLLLARGSGPSRKTFDITLQVEQVDMPDDRLKVMTEKYGNGVIGVIKLDAFYQNDEGVSTEKDVKEALQKLEGEQLRGLILDLRDNRGGFLNQAVKVAGLFITNGVVVVSKYASGEEKIYRDTDGKTYYKGPLIVLVSRLTASAAEIVSQALQDYGVALIVGDEHTYGKGTIQSQTVTEESGMPSYFKVTVGKYYTVSGKTPQMEGVKSDIVVPGPLAKRRIGEAFLEDTLPADQIANAYKDELSDVDPKIKAWYMKYYLPTLQPQEKIWSGLEDRLREKSRFRIQNNEAYQQFLRSNDSAFSPTEDLQLNEAITILKDMIYYESKEGRAKSLN